MNELIELTVDECLTLLGEGVVGRVAVVTPMGPRILPVNYTMYEDTIVFRTSPDTSLARFAVDGEVAFEIDYLDRERRQGWSVMAIGTGEVVDDPVELAAIKRDWDPQPWAQGHRHLYLRLNWRDLTGRRIGDEYDESLLRMGNRASRS